MEEKNQHLPEEQFGDNPAENLRIENELLKLKLQAERGASFMETDREIPPEIEAQFLQNIQAFEEAYEKATEYTVQSLLGNPVYPGAAELTPAEMEQTSNELISELQDRGIQIDFLASYPPEIIYTFLTTEFMELPVMKISVPGLMQCFIYEEYHPNHAYDIERAVRGFLQHWFEKSFNEYSIEFDSLLRSPEGIPVSRKELAQKLANCLDSYLSFANRIESPLQIGFDWNETEENGTGEVTGHCSYDARLENGLLIHYDGPFRFELTGQYQYWRICRFEFPGFAW